MKNGILLAMGLTAATALVGADRAVNAFLLVEGDGVSIESDGSIVCGKDASGPVKVSARPGWLVNGRESVSVDPKRGSGLKVTSKLGEDEEHVHVFPQSDDDVHSEDIVLAINATPASQIAMYALPGTSTVVSASATHKVDKRGKHTVTNTYANCECGEPHDPQMVVWTYDVEPDSCEWIASGPGLTLESSTWTGPVSKGLGQQISFKVTGKRPDCEACTCTASTNVLVDVHELSVTNDLYLGLDRTDFGRTNPVVKVAGALIDPEPTGSSAYSWVECGICSFTGRTDQATVRYFAPDPDRGSASHLAEPLTVRGTATNAEGQSASANCTTNFTVVKVDVSIGDIGEDKEESEGAFVQYILDAANGQWTEEGTNALVAVSITCEPENLPTNEVVTISAPAKSLYIRRRGKYYAISEETEFPAYLLSGVEFVLHGHEESGGLRDREIKVEHRKSGAVDLAKFTNVKLRVTNIKFNHDTSSSSRDAINIRRSYANGIDVSNGEWFDSGGVVANEPFCYTTNHAATVKARFEASGFITSAVIRATCAGAGGSLSSLIPTNVVFAGGVSSPEYVEFAMESNTLPAIDCSKGGVLGWQASEINGGIDVPCEMNASGPHIVYTILGEPKSPWKNVYGEKENAWTNALEFAIVKAAAAGKSTDKDALAAITTYLHSGHGLRYDTEKGRSRFIGGGGGGSMKLDDYIKASQDRSTSVVNCYDQAGGICSLGTLLGVDVRYAYMHPFGYINIVSLVGVGRCNNPFFGNKKRQYGTTAVVGSDLVYPERSAFGNHAFSKLGDDVFDCCAGPVCGMGEQSYKHNTIDTSTAKEAFEAAGGKVYYVGESCILRSGYQLDIVGVTGLR